MAQIVTGIAADENAPHMEAIYRFRHDFFVERMGWEEIRRPDGLERDQFDTADAVHLVEMTNGKVRFYSRLLPTTRPHLLSDVYPQILGGASAPRDRLTWEWTRGSIAPGARDSVNPADETTGRFYLAAIEACELLGIERLLVEAHPLMMTRMMEIGFDLTPLALPSDYRGHLLVPYVMSLTEETLSVARSKFGIFEPVLQRARERAPATQYA